MWPYVAGALVMVIGALFIFVVPNHLVHPNDVPDVMERAKIRHDDRATLLQSLAALVLLFGAGLTLRQLHVAREGQITERLTRAVDQLGSQSEGKKNLDVRIGGVYAMERIARDSEADIRAISQILTAYVRQNAIWDNSSEKWSFLYTRAPDVQAAMIVLAEGPLSEMERYGLFNYDLFNVDLRGLALPYRSLRWANLGGAHLERAILRNVDLRNAQLVGADLRSAILAEADLRQTNLVEANLQNANLREADIRDADLSSKSIVDGLLEIVIQYGLDPAELTVRGYARGAALLGADLTGAKLEGARLEGARADDRTKWPDNFPRKEAEARGVLFE
jgi:uncharacterized protein YjbI with pentapeptide repeats